MKEFFKIRSKKANRARIQIITIAVSLMLVAAIAIGGTVAWLVDTTKPVTNTFTFGDVDITLKESNPNTNDLALDADTTARPNKYDGLVPGQTQKKDPTVIVKANSVACYVFIKVEKSENFDTFFTATIDNSIWKSLTHENNVYYCVVNKEDAKNGKDLNVLKSQEVTVNNTVTKTMIKKLDETTYPTITFTAYAIQQDNLTDHNGDDKVDATDAWDLLNNQPNSSNP